MPALRLSAGARGASTTGTLPLWEARVDRELASREDNHVALA